MHIDVHDHAYEDLEQLAAVDPESAAVVLATLEQLEADPDLIDKLTTHGDVDVEESRLNIKRWVAGRARKNGDLWRLRILDSPATNYRVFYGYYWPSRQLCVLAVVKKSEFDYDPASILGQRILNDWCAV